MAIEEDSVEVAEKEMEKMAILPNAQDVDQHDTPTPKKKGGLITMPFIIGNYHIYV